MNFAVVVDVPPIEAAAAASALTTCNAALGAQRCALAVGDNAGAWYAVVRFDPERSTVFSIQLHDGGATGVQVATSQLEFKDRDSAQERWASAGVVVAALVAAQSASESPPPSPPVAAAPPPPPAPPPRPAPMRLAPPRAPYWLRADLGATGGSEHEHGALRFGPIARFGISFSELPVFALATGAYTVRGSGSPDSTWLTGSLGFGVRLAFTRRAALELRTEAVLESVSFHAVDGERSSSARRARWGPRFGLDLSGYLRKNLALVGGLEAAALRPGVDIAVHGNTVDRLQPFSWGFISAVRYDFR